MIARTVLEVIAWPVLVARASMPRPAAPGLDEETREHDVVDERGSRQIHGLTVPELLDARAVDPVDAHFDEAARIVRGETDEDFAALAVYAPSLRSPEVQTLLRRLARRDQT